MSGGLSILFAYLGFSKHKIFGLFEKPGLQRKIFWGMALLCFFVASAHIWTTEHKKLISESAYLQGTATGFYNNSPYRIGFPIKVLHIWRNKLAFPAKVKFIYGGIRLFPNHDITSQTEAIAGFKKQWEKELENNKKSTKEFKWIFMDQPVVIGGDGPLLTESLWKEIIDLRMPLFAVSAVRFTDGSGMHEAHMCQYLSGIIGDKLIWQDCDNYITQVDVEK